MNEFTAGSVIITHGSAGYSALAISKDWKEITSDAVLEMMTLLSWVLRGQECQKVLVFNQIRMRSIIH